MMRRFVGVLCMAVVGIVFTGCTKIVFTGSKGELDQKIRITSDPPGAEVFLMGSLSLGETPLLDVAIERTNDTFLTFKKEGYEDQKLLLRLRGSAKFGRWAGRISRESIGHVGGAGI
jgi:PEGA domain